VSLDPAELDPFFAYDPRTGAPKRRPDTAPGPGRASEEEAEGVAVGVVCVLTLVVLVAAIVGVLLDQSARHWRDAQATGWHSAREYGGDAPRR
jgi:hypothetical protein